MRANSAVIGNLATQVAVLLGRRIVEGEFSQGAVLPTEAELCDHYQVSRTTVRDAMKRLHGKGLIVGTARAGTRVLPADRWNQFDADILSWRLETGNDLTLLHELHEIRLCFEPEACRRAALHASEEDHKRMKTAYEAMAASRHCGAQVLEADLDFHMAIVDATHNRFFVTLGHAVKTALRVYFGLLKDRPNLPDDELAMHCAVAQAIAAGKGEEAAKVMREMILHGRRKIHDRLGPRLSRSTS